MSRFRRFFPFRRRARLQQFFGFQAVPIVGPGVAADLVEPSARDEAVHNLSGAAVGCSSLYTQHLKARITPAFVVGFIGQRQMHQ